MKIAEEEAGPAAEWKEESPPPDPQDTGRSDDGMLISGVAKASEDDSEKCKDALATTKRAPKRTRREETEAKVARSVDKEILEEGDKEEKEQQKEKMKAVQERGGVHKQGEEEKEEKIMEKEQEEEAGHKQGKRSEQHRDQKLSTACTGSSFLSAATRQAELLAEATLLAITMAEGGDFESDDLGNDNTTARSHKLLQVENVALRARVKILERRLRQR